VEAVALGDSTRGEETVGQAIVRSLGVVAPEEMAEWLRAADLYVHPSRADTFPSGVLEALACGTPVVASRVGGIPEQVTDETGVLVDPGDPAALAAAIESLLAHPERRARMSRAAAADAQARFGQERQLDAYLSLYADFAA
jgi:glycosyltransferase involved in cell wall biosynthesis